MILPHELLGKAYKSEAFPYYFVPPVEGGGMEIGMNANPILLQMKYARVIACFAERQGISLDAALGFFYHSEVYQLMRDGVSDMHCMSDTYLAEELTEEYRDKE